MIVDFQKQNEKTIRDFLTRMGQRSRIYSMFSHNLCPLLNGNDVYVYATKKETVIVCIDSVNPGDELADEDRFNDEEPLYFTTSSHRVSPVWKLSQTLEYFQKVIMERGFSETKIWGVFVTRSNLLNYEDMTDIWEGMRITVIHQLTGPLHWQVPVSERDTLYGASVVKAFLEEANTDLEFQRLLNEFIANDQTPQTKEEVSEEEESDNGDTLLNEEKHPDLFGTQPPQQDEPKVNMRVLSPIDDPIEELQKLVGCQNIKERMEELTTLVCYNKMKRQLDPAGKLHKVSLHSIFFGRPGTGKTTVCKILGSLLHKAGVLSKGHVVVCNRSTFLGRTWGYEEMAVRQAVERAQGGVLMIDEAYQLNSAHENDPGKLVIPLLMDILSDESQRDIAVVLCGYKNEMLKLLELNPGLDSRFPNRFEFKDFSMDELLEITLLRVGEFGYHFTRTAWMKYKTMLSDVYQKRDPDTWGNARYVSNQLDRIYLRHAYRCVNARKKAIGHFLSITSRDIQPMEVPRNKKLPRIGF